MLSRGPGKGPQSGKGGGGGGGLARPGHERGPGLLGRRECVAQVCTFLATSVFAYNGIGSPVGGELGSAGRVCLGIYIGKVRLYSTYTR